MTLPEVVYRCTWDTGWSQYHDASDPMPAKWDDKPPDFVEAFVSKIDAESRLAAADAEIERLREANKKLHRRCQEAEAALPSYRKLTALPPDGDGVRFVSGTMGRALLVSMCNKLQERGDAADALLRECVRFIDYGGAADDDLAEKIDAHLQGAGDEA